MTKTAVKEREPAQAEPKAASVKLPAVSGAQVKSVLFDMADRFGMEPAAFEATLRNTVVPAACSREQFAAFLLVAKEYNLNPLTKEIYAFPTKGGGIQPIVGVDGWANLINSHPSFDGMEFDDKVDEAGSLLTVTCRMFRKDRTHATAATEYMAECKRPTEPWQKWPRRMLRHKAMIQAARYAFGFAGIVDPDEADRFAAETARDVTPRRAMASTAQAFDEFAKPAAAKTIDHEAETGEVIDSDFGGSDPQDEQEQTSAGVAKEATVTIDGKATSSGGKTDPISTGKPQPEPKKDDPISSGTQGNAAAKSAADAPAGAAQPAAEGAVAGAQGKPGSETSGDPVDDLPDEGEVRRWPNGETPSNPDEYEHYAETKIGDFQKPGEIAPWWKSKEEIDLRKKCQVPQSMFEVILKKAQNRVATLTKK